MWQPKGGHKTQWQPSSSQKTFCPTFKCLTALLPSGVRFKAERSKEEKEEEVRKVCGRGKFKKRRLGRASCNLFSHSTSSPFFPFLEFLLSPNPRCDCSPICPTHSSFDSLSIPLFILQQLLISSRLPYLSSPSPFLSCYPFFLSFSFSYISSCLLTGSIISLFFSLSLNFLLISSVSFSSLFFLSGVRKN